MPLQVCWDCHGRKQIFLISAPAHKTSRQIFLSSTISVQAASKTQEALFGQGSPSTLILEGSTILLKIDTFSQLLAGLMALQNLVRMKNILSFLPQQWHGELRRKNF